MKILFFLALLANLVFFLWQYNAGAFRHTADTAELSNPKPQQIWLLSEVEKKQVQPIAATYTLPIFHPNIINLQAENNTPQLLSINPLPVIHTITAPARTAVAKKSSPIKKFYCYQIKGFASKKAASAWAKQHAFEASSLHIKEIQPVVADYLVNYPAAAMQSESKKNVAFLKGHGINNFFMINQGEFKGAISLGVFKNEARAIKMQRLLISQGINAKVSKRYQTKASVFAYIKTEKNKSQLLPSLLKQIRQPSVELLSKCNSL